MKIWLAALDAYGGGGITTHLNSLSSSLQGLGHEVKWITPGLGTLANISNIILEVSQTLFNPYPNHWILDIIETWASRLEFNLRLELEKERPDLIHCHDIIAFNRIKPIARNHRVPIILTIHGYIPEEEVRNGHIEDNSPEHHYLKKLEQTAISEADRVFAVGTDLKEYLLRIQPDANIKVMPNMIHESFINIKDEQKRENFGLPDDAFLLFCPSRFSFNKGVEYLIEAMSSLPPNVYLLLINHGNDQLHKEIEKWNVQDRCRIVKPVPHDEMSSLYTAADVCVLPSVKAGQSKETSSYSAIESMLVGTPVVASSIGGLKEVIGQYGKLVPERNPIEMAKAIVSMMDQNEHRYWSCLAKERGEAFLSRNILKDLLIEYETVKQKGEAENSSFETTIPYGISAQVLNVILFDLLNIKSAKDAFLMRLHQEFGDEYFNRVNRSVRISNEVIKKMNLYNTIK